MKSYQAKFLVAVAVALAVLFVTLTVIGGFRNYSPVPFWDMWGGYLDFFVKVKNGNYSAWWALHNEHRILFSRLLFYLDLDQFGGKAAFLIVCNYTLLAFFYYLFLRILNYLLPGTQQKRVRLIIASIICTLTFSWIQHPNLIWGFQSQFIAAYLFPLGAFFFLALSSLPDGRIHLFFTLAALLGFLSAGTMANGVIVLPLMVVIAILLKVSWSRIVVLGLLSGTELYLYYANYHAPRNLGSLTDALLNHWFDVGKYILLYLGGPMYHMAGIGSIYLSVIASLFLIVSSFFFTYTILLSSPRKHPVQLALLAFIAYVGGTALGTAGGRLVLGLEKALSSRYMTPSLMAWVSLLLLYVWFYNDRRSLTVKQAGLLIIIPILLLPAQLKALDGKHVTLFNRMVAALALEIGVRDEPLLAHIYPDTNRVIGIAEKSREDNSSIFGHKQIQDAKNQFGKTVKELPQVTCRGSLDGISIVSGDPEYLKVRGWVFDANADNTPSRVLVVDNDRTILGYAITGKPRPDVVSALAISDKAGLSGFKGYIKPDRTVNRVTLIGKEPDCILPDVNVKWPPYSLKRWVEDKPVQISVGYLSPAEIQSNAWAGKGTFEREKIREFSIFDSLNPEDISNGSLRLKAYSGAKILYKTGPVPLRQILRILDMKGKVLHENKMPATHEWGVLTFKADELPSTFIIEFIDSGSEWGEWSAVGLRE